MDNKISDITYTIICLVIIVVIVATTVIPVIEDVNIHTEKIYNNEDFYYSNLVEDSETHTITLADGVLTVGSDVIENLEEGQIPIVVSDSLFFVMTEDGQTASLYWLDGTTKKNFGNLVSATIEVDASTKAISVTDLVNASSTAFPDQSATYADHCYIIGTEGDYVTLGRLSGSESADLYVSGADSIFAMTPGFWGAAEWVWVYGSNGYSLDGGTPVLHATLQNVPGYTGVYKLHVTYSSGIYISVTDHNYIPSAIIVPASVTATSDGEPINGLLNVIPLLLLVLPVIIAARIITRRD